MAIPRLSTNRYVEPGAYIGQILRATGGVQLTDVRYPCVIGKGDRYFQMRNMSIRRSFISGESLSFDPLTYRALLDYNSDGRQVASIRLVTAKGIEIDFGKWQFVATNGDNVFDAIEISPEVYDQNEGYYLDYQSTDRTVLDPLPFNDVRQIKQVSLSQDNNQYVEFQNYHVPVSFGANVVTWGPSSESTITNDSNVITDNSSVLAASGNSYVGKYNRTYNFHCVSISGGNYTIAWRAVGNQYGNDVTPDTPVDAADVSTWPSFVITASANSQTIEGILSVVFNTANITESMDFVLTAKGLPLIEEDERYGNASLFASATAIYQGTLANMALGNLGTLVAEANIAVSSIATYAAGTSPRNRKVQFRCVEKVTTSGSESLTFWFSRYGVEGKSLTEITFDMSEDSDTQVFDGASITISNLSAVSVGDVFTYELQAPKIFCHIKDDRSYKFTATSVVSTTNLSLNYSTNTPEGRFGNVDVVRATEDGQFILPGNMVFHARNMLTGDTVNRWTQGDIIRFGDFAANPGVLCSDVIDWSLTQRKVNEVQDVLIDQNGSVTGEPGTYYVIVDNIPTSEASISMSEVATTGFSLTSLGRPYIQFATRPVDGDSVAVSSVHVSYEYAGAEPLPGQLYYITANVVRPDNMYDIPMLILNKEYGSSLLAPSTIDNDLYIANEIMWETNPPGIYVIQVKDNDGDGVYTKTDYERAIEASKQKKEITDKIVLNRILDTLPKLLAVNVEDNDPFVRREEFVWVGPEIGMAVGDSSTEDTIIYTAQNTLQLYGQSPAHGTRIMHGSSSCTKTIVLDNGTSAVVTLDGSFIAAYLAAKNASFTDASETLLKKTITAFDSIQVYDDPTNTLLGGNSVIFFREIGEGVYRIEEDVTVDNFNQNTQLINCMNQKQMVRKLVRTQMADSLISFVPPDVESGIAMVKANLVSILRTLLTQGKIANYQNEDGTNREFDINSDVKVEVDETDRTLFYFTYAYFTRKPIKRLYGMESVDSVNFSLL